MRNAGLEEAQAEIKIVRRNINNLRYADDTTLMAESEQELKSFLMKVKEDPGIGFLSRGDREIGVLRNVEPPTRPRLECFVRPASS